MNPIILEIINAIAECYRAGHQLLDFFLKTAESTVPLESDEKRKNGTIHLITTEAMKELNAYPILLVKKKCFTNKYLAAISLSHLNFKLTGRAMVTSFNFNNTSYKSAFLHDFQKLFPSINMNYQHTKAQNQRVILFEKIFERDDSHFLQECGKYILVDQLVTKGEASASPICCQNLTIIAKKLLHSCENNRLTVSHPENINTLQYIENIIVKAEAIVEDHGNLPPTLKNSAIELYEWANKLVQFFSKTWGKSIPYHFLSFQKFFNSWKKFNKILLQERLKALNP